MRLSSSSEGLDAQKDLADFSKWTLDVGEGNIEAVWQRKGKLKLLGLGYQMIYFL